MPYPERKCKLRRLLLFVVLLCVHHIAWPQATWNGWAGDGLWATAGNWVAGHLPLPTDDVLLDNNIVSGNYSVVLPDSLVAVTVRSITIAPLSGKTIQLIIPVTNTATPAFTTTGPGYGINISAGGLLTNASGSSGGAAIVVSDSIRIASGGQYTHNSRSSHATLVTQLSRMPGTEKGVFKFDVPGGGYTFASTNRVYGTLQLSAAASGGIQTYATSAANPLTIAGDLIIEEGVTVNMAVTAATTIRGNYLQRGGVFNLSSQPSSNTVHIQGDFMQDAGAITETSTGSPSIELNGNNSQQVKVSGHITNNVGFAINNPAGIVLLSNLSLPYKLSLLNGIVHTQAFVLTLQAGCSLLADSLSNNSFISGAVRKEGLFASAHFLLPVGSGSTQRWMALNNATGNYMVRFYKVDPNVLAAGTGTGIQHISTVEYWSVVPDTIPAPAAAIELSFNNVNSGGVTDLSALRVAQLVSGTWVNKGNTGTTGTAGGNGSVSSEPATVFDPVINYFTLASSNAAQNPLPVKLLSFNCSQRGETVYTAWTIEPSWQPAAFELQCSADGSYFETLCVMNGIDGQAAYDYTDPRLSPGHRFYRLKVLEKDGSSFFSNLESIDIGHQPVGLLQMIPSVVRDHARLIVNAGSNTTAQVGVYNAEGMQVDTKELLLHTGSNSILLSFPRLAAGWYTMTMTWPGNKMNTVRFIKVR